MGKAQSKYLGGQWGCHQCKTNLVLKLSINATVLPVELANGVASLSTYPSARILKMFAEENFKTPT